MADLGAIDEDVPFDAGTADTLITACRAAASSIDGQAGQRASSVTTAMTDFKGHFSELFSANAPTAAGDATELANRLREVATGAERLKEEARKEQERRQKARAWKKEHDDRSLWTSSGLGDRRATTRPSGPPADPVSVAVSPAVNRSRETPRRRRRLGRRWRGHLVGPAREPAHLRHRVAGRQRQLRPRAGRAARRLRELPGAVPLGHAERRRACSPASTPGSPRTTTTSAGRPTVAERVQGRRRRGRGLDPVRQRHRRRRCRPQRQRSPARTWSSTPSRRTAHPPTTGYADDPVNTATGNFVETETDLVFPAPRRRSSCRAPTTPSAPRRRTPRSRSAPSAPAGRRSARPGWPWTPSGPGSSCPTAARSSSRASARAGTAPSASASGSPGTSPRRAPGHRQRRLVVALRPPGVRCWRTGPVRVESRSLVDVSRDAEGRVVRLTHARGQWVSSTGRFGPAASGSSRRAPPTAARHLRLRRRGAAGLRDRRRRHPDLPLGRRRARRRRGRRGRRRRGREHLRRGGPGHPPAVPLRPDDAVRLPARAA